MAYLIDEKMRGYIIRYTLKIGPDYVRKQKRRKKKEQAEALRTELARLEQVREDLQRERGLTAEQAEAVFEAYRDVLAARGGPNAVDFAKMRMAYEDYILSRSKARDPTRKSHYNHMNQADQVLQWLQRDHPDLRLGPNDIKQWLEALTAEGCSTWTVHHKLTKLRHILDQAVHLGMIRTNSAKEVKIGQPKTAAPRRVLTPDEIKAVLDKSLEYRSTADFLSGALPVALRLGLYAGLRNEEITWLKWDAVDFDRRVIMVQETKREDTGQRWTPKDAELRSLGVKQELTDFLLAERRRQQKAGVLGVFVIPPRGAGQVDARKRPSAPEQLQRTFSKFLDLEDITSGGEKPTFYCLRHTFCTALLRAGVDIETVRARMGHATLQTTMSYLHEMDAEAHVEDALPY